MLDPFFFSLTYFTEKKCSRFRDKNGAPAGVQVERGWGPGGFCGSRACHHSMWKQNCLRWAASSNSSAMVLVHLPHKERKGRKRSIALTHIQNKTNSHGWDARDGNSRPLPEHPGGPERGRENEWRDYILVSWRGLLVAVCLSQEGSMLPHSQGWHPQSPLQNIPWYVQETPSPTWHWTPR